MNENKNIEASPPLSSLLRASSGVLNASDDSISQDTENVNRKFSDRDSSYLNAVNREDMETAQRMVDEAAKKAGYTVKVYHGTQSFGFTKLNVKNSDDGISFFATDAEETASTYAHGMSTRSINAKIKTATPKNLTASKEAILGHINDIKNEYTQLLGAGWLNFNEDFFEEDMKTFEEVSKRATRNRQEFLTFADEASETVIGDYNHIARNYAATQAKNRNSNIPADAVQRVDEIHQKYARLVKNEYKPYNKDSGVYALYANTDGHLVIDADGSSWSKISVSWDSELPSTKTWSTREVAESLSRNNCKHRL